MKEFIRAIFHLRDTSITAGTLSCNENFFLRLVTCGVLTWQDKAGLQEKDEAPPGEH